MLRRSVEAIVILIIDLKKNTKIMRHFTDEHHRVEPLQCSLQSHLRWVRRQRRSLLTLNYQVHLLKIMTLINRILP